ncbi:TetR/AcrR family transcriptional regulator C-terminal domain-containing protein [Myxococcus qinghaiensis]|uniref:TetR/AcrR family transcriptional regulator C-terminal domain-containing protein n=1 Tax=Myxococcus qinghaiensis TaxID=2906758 RepID=UPI0020A7EF48|nr:TetR/AcrR family transcriptional regulator C-terminal domain-containing protein [Myxococcus qinghaiensis]MCP3168282.1 TetR/AcrR family transcriptional regulator C-terminal domain-containing protein [Myxococcus qinghaiensis]
MPRPRSLTPSGIAAAALTVIDREGLDALTMRSVASALSMGTMSLYRYVEGREALESLVVDTVMRGIELPAPSSSVKWTTRVMGLMTRVREAVLQHPAVAPLLLTRRHSTTGTLAWAEALLGLLTEGGFDGTARVIAFRTLVSYVFGAVQLTHLGSLSGEGTAALAELDVTTYPLLRETARRAQKMAPEEEFRRGLELILRGMEESVARR